MRGGPGGAITYVGTSKNGNARIYSTHLNFKDTQFRDELGFAIRDGVLGLVIASIIGTSEPITIAYTIYKIICTYIDSLVDPVLIVPLAKDLDKKWVNESISYVGQVPEIDGISGMILLDFKGKGITASDLEHYASYAGLRIRARLFDLLPPYLYKENILIEGSEFLNLDPELNYIIIPESIFDVHVFPCSGGLEVDARLQYAIINGTAAEHSDKFKFSFKDVPDSEECGSDIVPEIAIGSGVTARLCHFDDNPYDTDDIFKFELQQSMKMDINTSGEMDTKGKLLNSSCSVMD